VVNSIINQINSLFFEYGAIRVINHQVLIDGQTIYVILRLKHSLQTMLRASLKRSFRVYKEIRTNELQQRASYQHEKLRMVRKKHRAGKELYTKDALPV
jgi:hypothetical protein